MGSAVAEMVVCEEKGKQQMAVDLSYDKGKHLVAMKIDSTPPLAASSPSRSYFTYPRALAKYKDVVASVELFMDTLEKLHAAMATKFMVPTIGGRELDLHRLFVEVTSRGGIEKVIGDRRWREVTATFSFPSTATNASFILRKYYMSLLHHYEQLYFFESQGWFSPPTGTMQPSPTTPSPGHRRVESLTHDAQVAPLKRRRNNGESASADLSTPTNHEVVGVVDGKFEHGYFVSVTIGTQKLKGILYPAPEPIVAQPSTADNRSANGVVRRRRRRKLSKRDPAHPKPNRSGYNFFFAEEHARLKPLNPGKDREISKMIGDAWNKLTETDKAVYQEKGVKDKERYISEMVVYRENLKRGLIISHAVPIQQRPSNLEAIMENVVPKMDIDESDFPSINQNESSSEGSEEEKESDEISETETSPEIGGTAADSPSFVAEPSMDADDSELQKKGDMRTSNGHDPPSSSEDAGHTTVRDP